MCRDKLKTAEKCFVIEKRGIVSNEACKACNYVVKCIISSLAV